MVIKKIDLGSRQPVARRQTAEEISAKAQEIRDYARWLQEAERWGKGPDHLVLFYDPKKVTTTSLLYWYDRKMRWFKPRRPIGRPPGSPKPKTSGKRAVSPEEALRAYTMDSRRTNWSDIAKTLWPTMKPAELRSDRTRLRVRYLIERGDRLTRKKTGN